MNKERVIFLLRMPTHRALGAVVIVHQMDLIGELKWLQTLWPILFGLQHALIQGLFPEQEFSKKYAHLPLLRL